MGRIFLQGLEQAVARGEREIGRVAQRLLTTVVMAASGVRTW